MYEQAAGLPPRITDTAPHFICKTYRAGEQAFINELPPTTDLYDTGFEEAAEQWHDNWMGLIRPE